MFATVSHDADLQHRPDAEVEEMEAGPLYFHELESDVASQQGCYSPVSSVSDMEPSVDHGTWLRSVYSLENIVLNTSRRCFITKLHRDRDHQQGNSSNHQERSHITEVGNAKKGAFGTETAPSYGEY